MQNKLFIFLIIITSFFLSSCATSIDSATDSLNGVWNITEIQLFNATESTTEANTDGSFQFESNGEALYSYSKNGELQVGAGNWILREEEENCGFTNCKVYFLNIDAQEFEVEFGDQTSDAHKNATEIRLLQSGAQLAPYTDMIISLNKD